MKLIENFHVQHVLATYIISHYIAWLIFFDSILIFILLYSLLPHAAHLGISA